jgi:hypothetical protein
MKLCVHCRHMKDRDCHHPNNVARSMVDGTLQPIHGPAYLRQAHPGTYAKCEPAGDWWEANNDYAAVMTKRDQLARHEGRPDQDLDVVGRVLRAGM